MVRFVATNDEGLRIGEGHPRSTIPDETVHRIRELREERNLTYGQISQIVDLPKDTVYKICRYWRRSQTPSRWKRIDS